MVFVDVGFVHGPILATFWEDYFEICTHSRSSPPQTVMPARVGHCSSNSVSSDEKLTLSFRMLRSILQTLRHPLAIKQGNVKPSIKHFGDLFLKGFLEGYGWFFPACKGKNIEGLRFNLLWKPTWLTKHLISPSEGRVMPLFLAFRGFQWGPIRFWWAILAGLSPIFSRGEIS